MTIRVSLQHTTRYRYDRPVALGPHEIRLAPAPACRTPVASYSLAVKPERHSMHWYQDAAGNHVARVVFQEKTPLLEITVELAADLTAINPFEFLVDPAALHFPFAYPEASRHELASFLTVAESGELLRDWLQRFQASEKPAGRGTVALLVRVNERLKQDIAYVTRPEHGVQSCEETLKLRRGSCRDSGWLFAQVLRHLGIAARFVSGYLIQLAGESPDAPTTDRADLHAWTEVYLPGAGWVAFDPSSGLLASASHIPLARASTPGLAAPIVGSVEPCRSQMDYSMSLRRL